MSKENPRRFVQKMDGLLVLVLVLFGSTLSADGWAQDAVSDRYAAIRAPTEALVERIGQIQLQADINALARERSRVQGLLRQAEYLRFQDPVSGLAAAERALDGRLNRLGTDLRESRARLAGQRREDRRAPVSALPSLRHAETAFAGPRTDPMAFDGAAMRQSVNDARAFVDDLLRANRQRGAP